MKFKHKKTIAVPNIAALSGKYPEVSKALNDIIKVIDEVSRNVYDDIHLLERTAYSSTTFPPASADMLGKCAIVTSGSDVSVRICITSGSSYVWKKLEFV
jgi:hypothetical protein